ncbi:GNAT family acetyltransferase [Herbiconiux sp. A18JL235]|uniref:GNAT family acetyltransferase n=1 Tax=Herbiconiux sp. A18JL235 TaxID=3152363 RepID=A0AB39BJQ8_9MICO
MARKRDLADQRQRLSEATWSVLTERGLAGLTIRAVAERAGCTTGLVMHAFPSKEALLLHARELLHERTRVRADAVEEEAGREPAAALLAVLLNGAALDDTGVDEARVWVSYLAASLADDGLAERHVAGNRSFIGRVGRWVALSRPDRTAEENSSDALALVALVEGLNALSSADAESYSPEVQRRVLGDAVARLVAGGAPGAGGGGAADAGAAAGDGGASGAGTAPVAAAEVAGAEGVGGASAGLGEGRRVRVRPYAEGDDEGIVALWAECGLTRPWNDPRRDIARKKTVQPELFLVGEAVDGDGRALRDGNGGPVVVATAMIGYDGHRGWVNYLAVAPGMQGHGVGGALMRQAEELLRERGCPKVNLQIRAGNEGVMAFYRSLGYEPDGAVGFGKRLIADA